VSHSAVGRVARYPPSFLARHPLRAARNLIGNHPSKLANRYLRGLSGVEIGGAAHNDFFLNTINVDLSPQPPTVPAQLRFAGRALPVDVIAPADMLPFADSAYDFVLTSHVLEHIPDPIGALEEWVRVSRRYVFLILPGRDNEFDSGRPLTALQELIDRHRDGFTSDLETHWSVWSTDTFSELCAHLGLGVLEVQNPDDKRGNGFAVLIDARRP
jgi:SAM-dependent methyltransferase